MRDINEIIRHLPETKVPWGFITGQLQKLDAEASKLLERPLGLAERHLMACLSALHLSCFAALSAIDDYNGMGGPPPEKALEMTIALLNEAQFEVSLRDPNLN